MSKNISPLKESFIFLKRWFAHPHWIGSLVPSSKALARFMAQSVAERLNPDEYVLELGAGTGRFTQALLDEGIPASRIICLEIDHELSHYLQGRFPSIEILQGNACFIRDLLPESYHGKIGVVLSGLPMLGFSLLVQEKILKGCLSLMKSKGPFLQFTYSPFPSIHSERFHVYMDKKRLGWVLKNFPPASVWCYSEKSL